MSLTSYNQYYVKLKQNSFTVPFTSKRLRALNILVTAVDTGTEVEADEHQVR